MYAGTGVCCLTQHNFSTIKDEQVFWQCLAIHQPQRFENCFSKHKKILALALQGQYHTAVNKESLQQAVKAAINSL